MSDFEPGESLKTDIDLIAGADSPFQPEYEYAHWHIKGGYADADRFETLEQAESERQMWMHPAHWKTVRRPKQQDWEDVK